MWRIPVACAAGALLWALSPAQGIAAPAACDPIFYPRVGSPVASSVVPHGPGLILMGGSTDVDAAFKWMARTISGHAKSGGDVVVLRAYGDNEYDTYIYALGNFNSVRTLLLPACSSSLQVAKAAAIVENADGVFFAGGDQANYVIWKGGPIAAAVQHVYARGGVIGGTSAGLAILGQYVFDAVAGDKTHDVHTPDAVADPWEDALSFTTGFLSFPQLRNTITDTHFAARDRLGRLTVFMGRLIEPAASAAARIRGIGVQERSALVVDGSGMATLLLQGPGGRALFLESGPPARMVPGKPFVSSAIQAIVIDKQGDRFDLMRWCGDGHRYTITVDGSHKPMYTPANPYFAPAGSASAACR